LYQIKKIKSKL